MRSGTAIPRRPAARTAPSARRLPIGGTIYDAFLPEFHKFWNGFDERRIAIRRDEGAGPGLFWLGGFKSDMKGTKAEALSQWARQNGRACVRFDYSGHGESGGDFRDGTIGRWLEESPCGFPEAYAADLRLSSAPPWAAGSRSAAARTETAQGGRRPASPPGWC